MSKHVLIAGAGGVVGNSALEVFSAEANCRITTVSRRRPANTFKAEFVSVDLLDEEASARVFSQMIDVTHVVYAAVIELEDLVAGWTDPLHVELNTRMLRNLFGPLERAAPSLKHVTIIHGGKAYGVHVRGVPVPSREDRDELRTIPNFYWNQEDYVRDLQHGKSWNWTVLRPEYVVGYATGSPSNLIIPLGVYAAVQKARGAAFSFTGGAKQIVDATDADLLARAMLWAGEAPGAANQVFNVANGDFFSWRDVWPTLAKAYGVELGEPKPGKLEPMIPLFEKEWEAIRARHSLEGVGLGGADLRAFGWLDRALAAGFNRPLPTMFLSTIKIRQAGFHDCIDTEKMFEKWIARHQAARLLPPPD